MLIYDIEILRAIPDRSGKREDGVVYCEGWSDFANMGVAIVGCYDYKTDRYRVFCEDNLLDFKLLVFSSECVVGFNNNRFDNRVLEAAGVQIPAEKSYDILEEIWRSLDLGTEFRPETHGGYGLEALVRANFQTAKTGNGALAPIQWQRGLIGSVVDYCLHDVYLTRKLLDRIIRCGALANPKYPQHPQQTIYLQKPHAHFNRKESE